MRLAVLLMILATAVRADTGVDVDTLSAEARQQIKQFAGELKATLKGGMTDGGPQHAVKLCREEAGPIAARHSSAGWQLGRTSLGVRNPDNQPDAWELSVLQDFEQRKAAGEKVAALEASRVSAGEFRYMKAIPTGGMCLACHGSKLSTPVTQVLDRLYPQDQARGFNLGDIRGAFTLTKSITEKK